jgi:hypothetical protein
MIHNYIALGMEDCDYVGFKAVCEGKIVGLVSGRSGIDFTYPHPELEEDIYNQFKNVTLYTPDALIVSQKCRNEGISKKLGDLFIDSLKRKKVQYILTELWIHTDGNIPALNPVSRWGTPVYTKELPLFYDKLSDYGMKCPLCGSNCKCGALVQVLKIENNDFEVEGTISRV